MARPKNHEKRITRQISPVALMVFLFLGYLTAHAQHNSVRNLFSVNEIRACAPFNLVITNANVGGGTKCSGTSACLMTFDNVQQSNTFNHLFTVAGQYYVKILYPNGLGVDSVQVTIDPNVQPAFEVYTCSGRKVSVNVTDRTYDTYSVDYGDGSALADASADLGYMPSPHTYPAVSPPPYLISVRGQNENGANNCDATVQSFDAVSSIPLPKLVTMTAVDASSVRLDFTSIPHVQIRVEAGLNTSTGGSFQLYQTVYGVNTLTVTGLDLIHNFYCFRINLFDVCSGVPRYSNVMCTQIVTAVAQSKENDISWVTSSLGVSRFEVSRDLTVIKTTPGSGTAYVDDDVVCNTNYCYSITAVYPGGGTSTSLSTCVTAFDSTIPPAVIDGSAVVGESQVDLTWLQDPAATTSEYSIFKSTYGGSYQPIATATGPSYADATYNTQANTCYRVDYKDLCGNQSPEGALICPVQLNGLLDLHNVISLRWSEYTGWSAGVHHYVLTKYNIDGGVMFNRNVGLDVTYVDDADDKINQVVSYKVTAFPNKASLTPSESNVLKFTKRINLYHPTAFTPNGDKVNDKFSVEGFFIKRMSLLIFDRWGTLLYASQEGDAWDGSVHGNKVTESTYIWKVDGEDMAGNTFSETGSILVLMNARLDR